MAEPVAISTSDQLAADFVRGLEPPQLRHNTLFTVLELIGDCSLFSDAIAPILAEAGFDIARLNHVPRSEILLPLASKALQVVLDRLARESHTIIESAAGASAAERIALLADVLGKADADASEAPRSTARTPSVTCVMLGMEYARSIAGRSSPPDGSSSLGRASSSTSDAPT